jgi:hypothetical protein
MKTIDTFKYREYYLATLANLIHPTILLFDQAAYDTMLDYFFSLFRDSQKMVNKSNMEFLKECFATYDGEAERFYSGGRWYQEEDRRSQYQGLVTILDNPDKYGYWVANCPYRILEREIKKIDSNPHNFQIYGLTSLWSMLDRKAQGEYPEEKVQRFPEQDLDWHKIKSMIVDKENFVKPELPSIKN